MKSKRPFFSGEMAAELKKTRERAGLTQRELARRLGFKDACGHAYICRLEQGKVKRPLLDTIVNYLHVCGARMVDFGVLLDRVEPLPELRIGDVRGEKPERVQQVENKVKREVAEYQRKAQYPTRTLPATPEKQRRGAEKLREYRIQADLVERALRRFLGNARVPTMYFGFYYNVGRQILGILRKHNEPKLSRKLDEVMARAEQEGLEARVLVEIRKITIEQHAQVTKLP
jgi:transcriptional regulator with XRE-family HTH domain